MTTELISHTPQHHLDTHQAMLTRQDLTTALRPALHSEWIKLTTLRSNKIILAMTAAIGAVASFSVAKLMADDFTVISEAFVFSTLFTSMIAAVAGILIFTSEVQHGTLAPTLTAQPTRWVIAVSKMQVAALFGAALGLGGMTAGFVGAMLGGLPLGSASTILETALWATLYTSLAAVLGLGVGMIARHSSAAITGLLIWALVIESLLYTIFSAEYSRFLPFLAGDEMLAIENFVEPTETGIAVLSRGQGALAFGAYAVVAMVVGTVLLSRRDTN